MALDRPLSAFLQRRYGDSTFTLPALLVQIRGERTAAAEPAAQAIAPLAFPTHRLTRIPLDAALVRFVLHGRNDAVPFAKCDRPDARWPRFRTVPAYNLVGISLQQQIKRLRREAP